MSILDNQQRLAKITVGFKMDSKKPLGSYITRNKIKKKIEKLGQKLLFKEEKREWIKTYFDKMDTSSLKKVENKLHSNGIDEIKKMDSLGKTKYIKLIVK